MGIEWSHRAAFDCEQDGHRLIEEHEELYEALAKRDARAVRSATKEEESNLLSLARDEGFSIRAFDYLTETTGEQMISVL